jgi:transcriptional regulator with XRE-family HTH domain
MASKRHNYLRTCRKRGGLTQDEMAFLLGCQSGTKVCRYERLSRDPNLEIVFAYQAIFGILPHELVPGIYKKVEHTVAERAGELSKKLDAEGPCANHKIQVLQAIASGKATPSRQDV